MLSRHSSLRQATGSLPPSHTRHPLRQIPHFPSVGTFRDAHLSRPHTRMSYELPGILPVDVEDGDEKVRKRGRLEEIKRLNSPARSSVANEARDDGLVPSKDDSTDTQYPRDERGNEINDNARIWRIYMDEATKADTAMIDGWNRSLDVLLVFTGLFSAVLTTFIIQSYQMIIPDPGNTTNALLIQMIAMQLNATSVASLSSSDTSNGSSPSNLQVHWVNGLWFAALACALSSALVSMMAKQWLQAYIPNLSGSPHYRARLRQARLLQFEAWHVPTIVNALPLLLHVALLLFFAGLIVLLWSSDIQITLVTLVIVALAYIFYSVSIWLPLFYPECPYYHPMSAHLLKWLSGQTSMWTNLKATNLKARIEARLADEQQDMIPEDLEALDGVGDRVLPIPTNVVPEDEVDAAALCWLFTNTTDRRVIAAALQAIAGLPREFTALHILRNADALHLVEEGFRSCFHIDATVDLQWHLHDADGAELYCRAWMRLAWGTAEKWAHEISDPLWILQELDSHPDVAAIASCVVALSLFDSIHAQWELLAHLSRYTSGEVQLAQVTQCWLLDSISECVVGWEMAQAVIEETTLRAVPTLLSLLRVTQDVRMSNVRSAAVLTLFLIVCGPLDLRVYRPEERRRIEYCELLLQALSAIVQSPTKFGVKDNLLDWASYELAHLASPVVAQSERFPQFLKVAARASLSKLLIEGRLGAGIIPDSTLVDVLQLLFPPKDVQPSQRPRLVVVLLRTLNTSSHPGIMGGAVRLLEMLLTDCSVAVSQAFVDNNGINAILHTARTDVDSRSLQTVSIRTICAFIDSITARYTPEQNAKENSQLNDQVDVLFHSDFFETLGSMPVASRKWWRFEVSGRWMPVLARLCHLRPWEPVWLNVITTLHKFADMNAKNDGYIVTLGYLEQMRQSIREFDLSDITDKKDEEGY